MALEVKITAKDEASKAIKQAQESAKKANQETAKTATDLERMFARTQQQIRGLTANIGTLTDSIKKTRSETDRGAGSFKGMQKSVDDTIRSLFGMSAQNLITGGGIALLAKKAFDFADQTAKTRENIGDLSEALGVSTDFVVNFGLAFDLTGGSAADAEPAIIKFVNTIKQAKEGNEGTLQTFKNLGVTLKNTDGSFKSTEQLLRETAVQISMVEDKSDSASYMLDLFGKTGTKFADALKEIGTNYDGVNRKADSFNLHFSDAERKKAEDYIRAMGELKNAFTGIRTELGEALIPKMADFLEGYLEYVRISRGEDLTAEMERRTKLLEQQTRLTNELVASGRAADAMNLPWVKSAMEGKTRGAAPSPYSTGRGDKDGTPAATAWESEFWATAEENEQMESIIDRKYDLIKKNEDEIAKIFKEKRGERISLEKSDAADREKWQKFELDVLKGAEQDLDKEAKAWEDTINSVADDLSGNVADAVVQLVSDFKHMNLTIKEVGNSILYSIVGSLAQALVKGAMLSMMQKAWSTRPGGLMGNVLDFMGYKEPAKETPMFIGHEGGIVPKFHTGGTNYNERFVKLTVDEGVIPPDSMRKLGRAGFERARRGQTGGGNTININTPMVDESWVRFNLVPILDRIHRKAG